MKYKLILQATAALFVCSLAAFAGESITPDAKAAALEASHAEARKQFAAALERAATGPEKASALIGIGGIFASEKNHAAARAEYEKALAIEGITPEQTGQALLGIGSSYFGESKWPQANTALDQVIAKKGASDASKLQAHLLTGSIFDNYGGEWGWSKSKAAYTAALLTPGISPEQTIATQKALVSALMGLKQYAEARAVMRELLANETLPSAVRAALHVSAGKTLLLEKTHAAARTEFAKALTMKDVSDGLRADIQLHIGLSYYEAQDYEHARPELMKVLEMPDAGSRATSIGGRMGYVPAREAMLRLRLRNLIPDDKKMLKVLFIGSSHTFREDVPELVRKLAASAPANQSRIIAGDFVRMGTGIDRFWNEGDSPGTARGVIMAEPWDAVVFETFYTMKREDLLKYGALFADLIRSRGAKPILYESPIAQASVYPDEFRRFHDDNLELAKVLKAPLAPSVQAWMKYLGPKPTAERFGTVYADWIHATPQGAYMSACCIFSALTGMSPIGLAHAGLPDSDAQLLQQAAWTAFREANPEVGR